MPGRSREKLAGTWPSRASAFLVVASHRSRYFDFFCADSVKKLPSYRPVVYGLIQGYFYEFFRSQHSDRFVD
jgi:hypothetical protein